jgi:hypothetical protein
MGFDPRTNLRAVLRLARRVLQVHVRKLETGG